MASTAGQEVGVAPPSTSTARWRSRSCTASARARPLEHERQVAEVPERLAEAMAEIIKG